MVKNFMKRCSAPLVDEKMSIQNKELRFSNHQNDKHWILKTSSLTHYFWKGPQNNKNTLSPNIGIFLI